MQECYLVSNLMIIGCKLNKTNESLELDRTLYKSIIGNLLYLTTSRPYIMHEIDIVGRFKATLRQSHLLTRKRILKYLRATMDFRTPEVNIFY